MVCVCVCVCVDIVKQCVSTVSKSDRRRTDFHMIDCRSEHRMQYSIVVVESSLWLQCRVSAITTLPLLPAGPMQYPCQRLYLMYITGRDGTAGCVPWLICRLQETTTTTRRPSVVVRRRTSTVRRPIHHAHCTARRRGGPKALVSSTGHNCSCLVAVGSR